jgi:hypothetical protein
MLPFLVPRPSFPGLSRKLRGRLNYMWKTRLRVSAQNTYTPFAAGILPIPSHLVSTVTVSLACLVLSALPASVYIVGPKRLQRARFFILEATHCSDI